VRHILRIAGPALCVLVLTACAGARPGVAASVGSDDITESQVATMAADYCSAAERQLQGQNVVLTRAWVSRVVLSALINRAVAERLAEKYDVTTGATYAQSAAAIEQATKQLAPGQAKAVLEVETAQKYVDDITVAVGRKVLEDQGATGVGTDEATAAGKDELGKMVAALDPQIDPKYGIVMGDTEPRYVDTSSSFAFSEQAREAMAAAGFEDSAAGGGSSTASPTQETQDKYLEYVRTLPDSQVCGRVA
jgi:hypothetical protein